MKISEARSILKSLGVNSLLSDPSDNPKLAKSIGMRALSAPLHLAPSRLSGHNVCPKATQGCIAACLHTAGNPAYMATKARARLARTKAFYSHRVAFMTALVDDVRKHEIAAKKLDMICGVRLNATSDIRFETIKVIRDNVTYTNIMSAFPNVQFYDYTKIANRRNLPTNYHLTFSLAENNDADALRAIDNNMSVAAVFNVGRNKDLPTHYTIGNRSIPVIDGDEHDFRPIDPKRMIIGLRAKGKAIGDKSGFVRAI